ncbi:MAG: glycosyltransferase family 39 protein [Leptolyngbya sp. SIO1E4]|nr:glycosyltransferase family 39 protein [Leptolyngbya sp. SIO1E4]
MSIRTRQLRQGPGSRWGWAIAVSLMAGCLLRWVNLGGKVFWHDEVYTALRVVGHMGSVVEQTLFTGVPFTAETLLQYQTFAAESTFLDTLGSLVDHPEHPPLYYLLAWAWVSLVGTSVTAFRSLSVIFSVLTLPALAGFARELFGRHPAVIIAPLLFACSPVQVLYAQEAREYSLWVLLTVLASWALLRAVRLGTRKAWGLYALALALLFYTSILSALVAIAYGLYGIWVLPRRRWPTLAASFLLALLLFLPWLGVIIAQAHRWQQVTAWTLDEFPRSIMVKLWGLHFSALFVDPNLSLDHAYTYLVPPLAVLLIGISLYRCWQRFPHQAGAMVVALVVVPTVALIGGDLLRGSRLSTETRYFLPVLMAAQVAVAGWLGTHYRTQRLVLLGLTGLIGLGLVNSMIMTKAPTWWSKREGTFNYAIATAIASIQNPVVMTQKEGTTLGNLISLSYHLPAQTSFQVTLAPDIPEPNGEQPQTLLLFRPSELLRNAYDCPAEPFPGVLALLWRIPCR